MKYVIFLGDGMADYPVKALGGKTPLMVARKPAIDLIARNGRTGLFVTIEPDMSTGSAVANLSVLGYDPRTTFQGRGVLEAASLNVTLEPDDCALRMNLICVENGMIRSHSAGHITNEEAGKLVAACQKAFSNEGVAVYEGLSYRHLLVLPGGDPRIECAPPHDHVGGKVEDLMPKPKTDEATYTAQKLIKLIRRSWEFLPDHPVNQARKAAGKQEANSIWPWSPGRRPLMKTFQERYGLKGAVISAVDLIKGLGIYAGMTVIEVEGATGLSDTNYEGKADAGLKALEDHDLVFIHVEASDEAGHDRNLDLKIKCIEYLDQRLIQRVLDGLVAKGIEATVAVLPDHPTPVEQGIHVRDPVPVAVWNPQIPRDKVDQFDENSVKQGTLGLLRGADFIETVIGKK